MYNDQDRSGIDNGSAYTQYASMVLTSAHDLHNKSWPKALEIDGWSEAIWLRNKETEEHTLGVADLTVRLAILAEIPESELLYVRYGALLHDIGKIGIPDMLLLKPGRLSESEWMIMRRHPDYAYDLLNPIDYLRPCLSIPYSHHEKWDGTGYPLGLKGEQIPLPVRLFSIVDVWETLSSKRIYREAWEQERVLEYIQQQSGTYFDPRVVDLFVHAMSSNRYTDGAGHGELPLAW